MHLLNPIPGPTQQAPPGAVTLTCHCQEPVSRRAVCPLEPSPQLSERGASGGLRPGGSEGSPVHSISALGFPWDKWE